MNGQMTIKQFTIAIDGPAAAGKGTLSRKIAETYGFHHLDTGLTYRATAKALLDAGLTLDDEAVAEKMARDVELAGLDRDILETRDRRGRLEDRGDAWRAACTGGCAAAVFGKGAWYGARRP